MTGQYTKFTANKRSNQPLSGVDVLSTVLVTFLGLTLERHRTVCMIVLTRLHKIIIAAVVFSPVAIS